LQEATTTLQEWAQHLSSQHVAFVSPESASSSLTAGQPSSSHGEAADWLISQSLFSSNTDHVEFLPAEEASIDQFSHLSLPTTNVHFLQTPAASLSLPIPGTDLTHPHPASSHGMTYPQRPEHLRPTIGDTFLDGPPPPFTGTHSPDTLPPDESQQQQATILPGLTLSRSKRRTPPACQADDDDTLDKRRRNNAAARKYRQRKIDRIKELEDQVADIGRERDELRIRLARHEAETAALREILRLQGGRPGERPGVNS
jgi:hypothetical protein